MSDQIERFLEFVEVGGDDECWLWYGRRRGAYGSFTLDGRTTNAHRAGWILLVGEISPGFHVHHLCKTPLCVNPAHLRLLSPGAHARLHVPDRHWQPADPADRYLRRSRLEEGP